MAQCNASERNYCVRTAAGEERRNLLRQQAYDLALKRWQQWLDLGQRDAAASVTVFYQPTGQAVPADRWRGD